MACQRDAGVKTEVDDYLSEALFQELVDNGFQFNEGDAPPIVEGEYIFEPMNEYDNSGVFSVGQSALNTVWRFDRQQGSSLDVYITGWTSAGLIDTSYATIIEGNSNDFTILAEAYGSSGGIDYTYVYALTGTYTEGGVENAQFAFIMTDNPGAPNVATQETIRLFKDLDAMASATAVEQ